MEHSLVSLIIPIYNISAYLDACVQSACSQTYKNLEIILVDDGSPDDCPQKCDAWAARDSRIKVIHKKNGGLSDARNAGLDAATGKYIYFLDGDDYIKPELIETVVSYMDDGFDMVTFNFESVSQNEKVVGGSSYEYGEYEITSKREQYEFLIYKLLTCKIGWESWSRIFSHELINKYNLRFADNRRIFAEDMYFCLCYCSHAHKIVSIPSRFYCYRQRTDSIMGQDSVKLNIGRMNELAKSTLDHLLKYDDCDLLAHNFPIIHFLIIDNVFSRALGRNKLPLWEFRNNVWEDIGDTEFFNRQIRLLPKYRNDLVSIFSASQAAEKLSLIRYLRDGNLTALRLRNRAIYKFSGFLDQCLKSAPKNKDQYKEIGKYSKRVFILGTEEFGNIGDHQINEAIVAFLHQTLPEHYIHEVTAFEWSVHKTALYKTISSKDLIVFAGGGNFGDVYPFAHNLRSEVIKRWPRNKKIIFPQTIFFSDSEEGRKSLDEAKKLYSKKNNVILFTREQKSFEFAKKHFLCDIYLTPDIVLSSQVRQGQARTNQVLLCMRQDVERVLSEDEEAEIIKICYSLTENVKYTDLQLHYNVKRNFRKSAIEEKLDLWRNSKVVITDRLHGMVFAAVTGTPCIVFSNYNHKVRGTYEWIRYLPYIRFAASVADVEKYLPELLAMDACEFDNAPLKPYFDQLKKVVKENAHN